MLNMSLSLASWSIEITARGVSSLRQFYSLGPNLCALTTRAEITWNSGKTLWDCCKDPYNRSTIFYVNVLAQLAFLTAQGTEVAVRVGCPCSGQIKKRVIIITSCLSTVSVVGNIVAYKIRDKWDLLKALPKILVSANSSAQYVLQFNPEYFQGNERLLKAVNFSKTMENLRQTWTGLQPAISYLFQHFCAQTTVPPQTLLNQPAAIIIDEGDLKEGALHDDEDDAIDTCAAENKTSNRLENESNQKQELDFVAFTPQSPHTVGETRALQAQEEQIDNYFNLIDKTADPLMDELNSIKNWQNLEEISPGLAEILDLTYMCKMSGCPIRFAMSPSTDTADTSLVFDRKRVKNWLIDHPHIAPPGWPTDILPLPLRPSYFIENRDLQRQIDQKFEECLKEIDL